jgi:hypothetical protein
LPYFLILEVVIPLWKWVARKRCKKKQRSSASQKQINCQVPKIVIQGRDMSEN